MSEELINNWKKQLAEADKKKAEASNKAIKEVEANKDSYIKKISDPIDAPEKIDPTKAIEDFENKIKEGKNENTQKAENVSLEIKSIDKLYDSRTDYISASIKDFIAGKGVNQSPTFSKRYGIGKDVVIEPNRGGEVTYEQKIHELSTANAELGITKNRDKGIPLLLNKNKSETETTKARLIDDLYVERTDMLDGTAKELKEGVNLTKEPIFSKEYGIGPNTVDIDGRKVTYEQAIYNFIQKDLGLDDYVGAKIDLTDKKKLYENITALILLGLEQNKIKLNTKLIAIRMQFASIKGYNNNELNKVIGEVFALDDIIDRYIRSNLYTADDTLIKFIIDNKDNPENYPIDIENNRNRSAPARWKQGDFEKVTMPMTGEKDVSIKKQVEVAEKDALKKRSDYMEFVSDDGGVFEERQAVFNVKYGYLPSLLDWLALNINELTKEGTNPIEFLGLNVANVLKATPGLGWLGKAFNNKFVSFFLYNAFIAYPQNTFYGKGKVWNPFAMFLAGMPILRGNVLHAVDIKTGTLPGIIGSGGLELVFGTEPLEYYLVSKDESNLDNDLFFEVDKIPLKIEEPTGLKRLVGLFEAKTRQDLIAEITVSKNLGKFSQRKPVEIGDGPIKSKYIVIDTTTEEGRKYWKKRTSLAVYPSDMDFGVVDYDAIQRPLANTTDETVENLLTHSLIPFWFKDLRKYKGANNYLFFKAFLNSLSERLSPNITSEMYFGRTDPVMISNTNVTRTVSIGFQIACFYPHDLEAMWNKINWLNSMLYTSYTDGIAYQSPLIEVRLGNFLCVAKGTEKNKGYSGVPCKIMGLDYSFDKDVPWELDKNIQLPVWAEIGLELQIFHSKPIVINVNKGKMNFENFRIFDGSVTSEGMTKYAT